METIIKSNYANVEEINVTKFIDEIKADTGNRRRHEIVAIGNQCSAVLLALKTHGAKVTITFINNNNNDLELMPTIDGVTYPSLMNLEGYLSTGGEISLSISKGWYNHILFAYKDKFYRWSKRSGEIYLYNSVLDKAPYEKIQYFKFDGQEPNKMHKPNLRAIQRWVDYLERKEQAAKEYIQQQDDNETRLLDELDKAGVKYQKSGDREYTLYCGIHRQKVYISDTGVTFYTPEVDWSAYQKAMKNFNGEFADLALLTKLAAI